MTEDSGLKGSHRDMAEDSGLKGSHAPKPKKNAAKPGDTVLPFKCPDCGHEHYIWLDIQRIPELERNEIGQIVRDPEGKPVEKTHLVRDYISVPRLHPAWTPELEPELKVLYERSQAEREFAEKNKRPKIIAEALA